MTEEDKGFSCVDCDDVLLCPYPNKFQCPKLTIERDAGNE